MFEFAELAHRVPKYWFHVEKPPPRYKRFLKVSEEFVRRTSTAEAPWIVLPAAEKRFRSLTFGRHLLAALRERLDEKPVRRHADKHPPLAEPADKLNVLRALQLDQPMGKAASRKELGHWQEKLGALSRASACASVRSSPCSRETTPPARAAPSDG